MNIYQLLSAVMSDVSSVKKAERNQAQGFNFRGIDAVVNAVGPALRKHGVVVFPELVSCEQNSVEVGKNRSVMAQTRVTVTYRFYGPEGDSVAATVAGEAMDSGDKATAKAMSVAFRTALLQALTLPTDEPDPDQDSYERAPKAVPSFTAALAPADLVAHIATIESADELRAVWADATDILAVQVGELSVKDHILKRVNELKAQLCC